MQGQPSTAQGHPGHRPTALQLRNGAGPWRAPRGVPGDARLFVTGTPVPLWDLNRSVMKEVRRRREESPGILCRKGVKEQRKQESSIQKPSSEAAKETLSVGGEEIQRKVQTPNLLGKRSVRAGQMRVTTEN